MIETKKNLKIKIKNKGSLRQAGLRWAGVLRRCTPVTWPRCRAPLPPDWGFRSSLRPRASVLDGHSLTLRAPVGTPGTLSTHPSSWTVCPFPLYPESCLDCGYRVCGFVSSSRGSKPE